MLCKTGESCADQREKGQKLIAQRATTLFSFQRTLEFQYRRMLSTVINAVGVQELIFWRERMNVTEMEGGILR